MLAQVNHPISLEPDGREIMQVKSARFLEVYNGHPATRGQGDAYHASTERIWDIVLTWRLSRLGLGPIYAIADDDCHYYRRIGPNFANPARLDHGPGPRLAAADLLKAWRLGISMPRRRGAEEGAALPECAGARSGTGADVTYQIQFVGTRKALMRHINR